MTQEHPEDWQESVPVEALEELIKNWQDTPEYLKLHRGKYEAAQELIEVINAETGGQDE